MHPVANRTSFDSLEGVRSNEPVAGAHRPVAWGSRFERRAWGSLALVERIGLDEARLMMLRCLYEFCVETRRRCGRCARQIAAKRTPTAHGVGS